MGQQGHQGIGGGGQEEGGVYVFIYGSRNAQVSFTQNFRLLTTLLKIFLLYQGGGHLISFYHNTSIIYTKFQPSKTQLLKVLEFNHVDLNFEI